MNTGALQPLEGRWPRDEALSKQDPSWAEAITQFQNLLSSNEFANVQLNPDDSRAVAQFATDNGLAYNGLPSVTISPSRHNPAWLGPLPTNTPAFRHEVAGTLFGYNITFCVEYRPAVFRDKRKERLDVPHGYGRIMLAQRGIIRVKLPALFPQLVLDSNQNDHGYTSSILASIQDKQKLSLEGNFAQHFDFYAPIGIHVNALTVLAPNFMEILMNSSSNFDVEFYGNELILVTRDPLYTPAVMQNAIDALEAQLTYLSRLIASWNYQPLKQPFDTLEYTFINGGGFFKIGSIRIKPALFILLVLGGMVGAVVLLNVLFGERTP